MPDPGELSRNMQRMEQAVDAIEETTLDMLALAQTAAEAEAKWDMEQAKALMEAKLKPDLKSAELRKAWAMCQPGMDALYLAHLSSDALAKAVAVRVKGLLSQADLLRSINRSGQDLAEKHHGERR